MEEVMYKTDLEAEEALGVEANEIIICDFREIVAIRKRVRELVAQYTQKAARHGRKGSYDYSMFYIGKGVTRVFFRNLYVPAQKMQKLSYIMLMEYSGVFVQGNNLTVYLRGYKYK